MTNPATTAKVWEAINNELFAVLGMVTSQGESRTVGIVYLVKNRKLYIATGMDTWKARHVRANPQVSITIPIAKRIPFAPWVKIPQATISFAGRARIIPGPDLAPEMLQALLRHKAEDPEYVQTICAIEVEPEGEFVTYGIGIPLIQMRHPELARGRAPVK